MRTRTTLAALALAGLLVAACSDDSTAPPSTTGSSVTTAPAATDAPATTDAPPSTDPVDDGNFHATIRRTTDGVPHISGATFNDVVFGQGYANAQDHACTLADAMLTPLGTRAENLGPGDDNANVNSDIAWRAIGIAEIARADWAEAPERVTSAMGAFAQGWNQYLGEVGSDGLSGWCAGESWVHEITAEDLYVYARWIPLLASSAQLEQYIPSAQPPATIPVSSSWRAPADADTSTGASTAAEFDLDAAAAAFASLPTPVASNAWAVGSDKVTGGTGGMLIANPHFPWEGSLRFWEVQLTVPGEMNVYGSMLIGVPGVGIGFTDHFAWSHTVSAGHRFTGYQLTLDPADATHYMVDGESIPMTSKDVEVKVRQPDGSTTTESRTMWASEYGPIIDFPGVGWSATTTLSYRDANITNNEFVEQYFDMDTATSFDEFIDAHRRNQGIPLFNTTAVSSDGRAWYADTSATPKLSNSAELKYDQMRQSNPLAKIAYGSGLILLDGSDSDFRWEEVPGARDPGLVPFDEMPMVERSDYVFNANDSFWMPHATEMLHGDYSIMLGDQDTERSLRTRENAMVLSETGDGTPAGADGTFTSEELRAAAVYNEASSAVLLREPVVDRCRAVLLADVPELSGDGGVVLPAETIDLAYACDTLAAWDNHYDIDSRGAVLWHEFLSAVRRDVEGGLGGLWAVPFDAADPLNTPRGLAPAPDGQPDPVITSLARAVQTLTKAGRALDEPLGDVQYALRANPRIGIHGGPGPDGLTNVVDYGNTSNTSEPMNDPGSPVVRGSDLRPDGYPIDRGTSFLMNVDFTGDSPQAWVILTYGETGDRTSPLFTVQTERFHNKDWRQVAYTDAETEADPALTTLDLTSVLPRP